MSKAFTNDDVNSTVAVRPLPVGRRPITARGMAAAQKTLRDMVDRQRPALLAAAVHDAEVRAKLQALTYEIQTLERRLFLSDVVAPPASPITRAALGVRVEVVDEDDETTHVYVLVGPDEVDVARRRVSHASPVGQALLGYKVGERTFIKRPAGTLEVRIVSLQLDDGPAFGG